MVVDAGNQYIYRYHKVVVDYARVKSGAAVILEHKPSKCVVNSSLNVVTHSVHLLSQLTVFLSHDRSVYSCIPSITSRRVDANCSQSTLTRVDQPCSVRHSA